MLFIGCSDFTNIAYGHYYFELRSFNIMKELDTEILTSWVEIFCLEDQNFWSAPWSTPYVAMATRKNAFGYILKMLIIYEECRDPNFTLGQFSWNFNRKYDCICSPRTFWTNLIVRKDFLTFVPWGSQNECLLWIRTEPLFQIKVLLKDKKKNKK